MKVIGKDSIKEMCDLPKEKETKQKSDFYSTKVKKFFS